MKGKGIAALLVLLLLSFISGCMGANPDRLMQKPSRSEEQEKALAQIEQDIPRGAIKEIRQIALSGQDPVECVVIYKVPLKDAVTPKIAGIIVEQYDAASKSWHKVWEGKWEFRELSFMGKARLMGDEREQAAIGCWSGNGGYFEYILLGMQEGKVTPLVNEIGDEKGIPSGSLKFEKDGFTVFSGSQGSHYKWDGQIFTASPVVAAPDMNKKKNKDLILHYSFDAQENGKLDWPADKPVSLKVGQKLYLVRDNANGIWERIMSNGADQVLEVIDWGVFEAQNAGTTEISIVPNGYDWEKELKIEVVVTAP